MFKIFFFGIFRDFSGFFVERGVTKNPEVVSRRGPTITPRRKHQKDPGKQDIQAPKVTLRFEGNNLPTAALSPDESGRTLPLIPGPLSYSDKVRGSTASPESSDFNDEEKTKKIEGIKARRQLRESKTLIFSDSITRDITRKRRSFDERCSKSNVAFHEFKGKKASDIVRCFRGIVIA